MIVVRLNFEFRTSTPKNASATSVYIRIVKSSLYISNFERCMHRCGCPGESENTVAPPQDKRSKTIPRSSRASKLRRKKESLLYLTFAYIYVNKHICERFIRNLHLYARGINAANFRRRLKRAFLFAAPPKSCFPQISSAEVVRASLLGKCLYSVYVCVCVECSK